MGTNPGLFTDEDRAVPVGKVWFPKVMIASTEKGALGDAGVRFDPAGFEVENEDLFPDPDVIPEDKFPGKVDVDPGLDIDPGSDLRSEKTEQPDLKTARPRQGGQKEEALRQIPDRLEGF